MNIFQAEALLESGIHMCERYNEQNTGRHVNEEIYLVQQNKR